MCKTAVAFTLALLVAVPASAQEFIDYQNSEDGFAVNFPGQPQMTTSTWKSLFDYELPARIYSANRGPERYTVTVVDYTGLQQLGIERAKRCEPGNAQCRQNAGVMGPGYWQHDMRATIMFATSKFVLREGAKVTQIGWEWQEMVEGNFIQLTNADKSRSFVWVTMHEKKLYIAEATVPAGRPEPGLFQQSWSFIDPAGNRIRYQQVIYSNAYHGMGAYPRPSYGNQGRGAGAGAGGGGAGAAPAPAGRGAGAAQN
jgi:hypothetical protein